MSKFGKSTLAAAAFLALTAASGSAATLYQAPANVVGGYCPTCAGTATTLGDDISLDGGPARLSQLTWDTSNYGTDYNADIVVEFFNVDLSGAFPALGSLIASQTTTHFLTGQASGNTRRSFVDILLDLVVPERFIYTISVENNNGGTNWNMAGQLTDSAVGEDATLADAQVGTNHETDYFFADWVLAPGTDTAALSVGRMGMGAFQLGLPGSEDAAAFSNVTPNVTFQGTSLAAVPLPAGLPLLIAGLGALGLMRRRRNPA
ncbi:VPLPA-CTERM sorting domain-containing protein [Puniceibacterium sp. IMCC21224]|uniref:VPLPA-CTERM sorting domain-containing protein n=1 Tax=Puniceibacterium sp. IMCC21224 TaxID=1618204 RepID=UPI00065D1210|nr:VPLPA-CTERM sorting domain-containing protein [Puniceibacterium sp. IMCC21224]KMK66191.1 hypothetical protein IMCC21224_111038 [Puniceibacterium sp. IMCC21224]